MNWMGGINHKYYLTEDPSAKPGKSLLGPIEKIIRLGLHPYDLQPLLCSQKCVWLLLCYHSSQSDRTASTDLDRRRRRRPPTTLGKMQKKTVVVVVVKEKLFQNVIGVVV